MPPNIADGPTQPKVFTLEEISKHNKRNDFYVAHGSKVYDLTSFVPLHPGGELLLTYAGEKIDDVFATFHPPSAYSMLSKYCIGELQEEKRKTGKVEFVDDFRKFRKVCKDSGYFSCSKPYYAFKVLSNIAILAFSLFVLSNWGSSYVGLSFSAFLLGLFWQQCGWLSHDFLHHQVFTYRPYNNIAGFILGDWFQGFSVDWWKNKHNTHHAVPNVHDVMGDPDIDTLPFLAWSEHALEGFPQQDAVPKFLIRNQVLFYVPLLFFARLSWAIQSALWVKSHSKKMKDFLPEAFFISLHWISYFAIIGYFIDNFFDRFVYFLLSQGSCGLLLASVFALNHNGMPVMNKEESLSIDYFSRQILTGRAVIQNSKLGTAFMTWFTGGLNYQIEHHLFPMVARHHLGKIHPVVKQMCKKHGIKYHQTTFLDGSWEVIRALDQVQKEAQKIEN